MFKFNFLLDDQPDTETKNVSEIEDVQESCNQNADGWEIEVSSRHHERLEQYQSEQSSITSLRKYHLVDLKYVERLITSEAADFGRLNTALQLNSDVIKGVYEGGLKIWECTLDLLDHLEKEAFTFEGLTVLDLGCGAGLLGIQALNMGASAVHFQDYNAEVLDLVTILNVLLNSCPEKHGTTKFFAGDWGALTDKLDSYDVVLTAETIYNPENYSKLLRLFERVTKKNTIIYLAAKHHYFGVGGDIGEFLNLLKKNERWQPVICFSTAEGVKREILKITSLF